MKRLIIVGNPFQLILALMIRNTLFDDNSVTDLMLFESVLGWKSFKERLDALNQFRKVFSIAEVQPKGNRGKKLKDIFNIISGHGDRIDYIAGSELAQSDYDEVWYYNYCPWFYGIYDLLTAKGKDVKFIAYMESVFVYTYLRNDGMKVRRSLKERIISSGRSINGRWVFKPYSEKVYVQFPEMTDKIEGVVIKKIPYPEDPNQMTSIIKKVFNAPSYNDLPKYIFMASSLEFDGFGEGETDLIIQIADIIGRDNMVVKLHPRDNRGIIEKAGIRVLESSNVCWEAIQAVNDFSDKVFLTLASASIMNSELFTGQEVKAYYLYPMIPKMTPTFSEYCSKSVGKTLDMVHDNDMALNTLVINNMEELKTVLVKKVEGS